MLDLRSALLLNRYRLDGCAVQIPPSPQDHVAKRYREIDTFCFYTFGASLLADEGVETKDVGLPLFAQWVCKGPCGEQKGKALSGATIGSVVANSSLSATKFTSLIPCRKLACRQRCEKQRERLAAFCAVGLQGPLRRAEGKGVKRSDHRERSSQSLSLRMI